MQIPMFWAEARVEGKLPDKRRRVVRRFGWSDQSQDEAQAHAEQRAAAAWQALLRGEKTIPREHRVAYGGAEGLPIREQIVARNHGVVVTRNSYGARCLNVPDVWIADVDHVRASLGRWSCIVLVLVPGLGALSMVLFVREIGASLTKIAAAGVFLVLFVVLLFLLSRLENWRGRRNRPHLAERVRAVAAAQPNGRFALYRTPAGLRVIALHRQFAARSDDSRALLTAFGSDPVYVQMCTLQDCFRARVSAKPWRAGIQDHIRPRRVWPVPAELLPVRDEWLERYETAAAGFAACEFVEEIGDGPRHPRCEQVQRLHDELCGARSGKPLA